MSINFNCLCRTYLRSRRPVGDDVLVEVVVRVPDLAPERGGHGEEGREEPDEGDEDGVRPRSINQTLLNAISLHWKETESCRQNFLFTLQYCSYPESY